MCTCKNGVGQAGTGCLTSGATKCASCNAGYTINHARTECTRTFTSVFELVRVYACTHKHEGQPTLAIIRPCHFAVNACTCNHGVAKTGAGCPVNGAAKCESCDTGRMLNQDRTQCTRTLVYLNIQNEHNISCGCVLAHFCFDAVAKSCTCTNGIAQTGADCSVNGGAKCESCHTGWTINHASTACIRTCEFCCCTRKPILVMRTFMHCDSAANVCTCHNGVGQTGAACPVSGAAKCSSCNSGWTLNDDKTECIGARIVSLIFANTY